MPEVVTGHPGRNAIWRAMLKPVAPSGLAQPMSTSSMAAGSTRARSIACLTACAPSVAPCVRLKAPRHDFVSAVRAVDTMTASTTTLLLLCRRVFEGLALRSELCEELRRLPESGVGVFVGREFLHAPDYHAETHAACVEHRPATLHGESVAGEIYHVDVGRPLRDAFLEDVRTFIHQRIDQPVDDLRIADLARLDLQGLAFLGDDLVDDRVRDRVTPP